mmetsp:Transcript_75962/g.214058  ORF Transcript_75962/g.214058 Transcript_75962/m.214058 type:complete len:306 (-) Transcript_75962:78-995(-)
MASSKRRPLRAAVAAVLAVALTSGLHRSERSAFVGPRAGRSSASAAAPRVALWALAPASPGMVRIEADADAVAAAVMSCVNEAAEAAIKERGYFALGVPGGSILNMLAGSTPSWASKTTLAYVNHKCVAMSDEKLATHAKASKKFLDGWDGVNTIVMTGSADGKLEADNYEAQLRALPETVLPRDSKGMPVFDMMLIGVGDDGHVGSLYPNRDEVLQTDKWVLPVAMKDPPSITLSLPVMAGAKRVIIAACGVSEKYPQGKSDAMKRGIEGAEELRSFPAAGLRPCATWIMDAASASKLSSEYGR